MTLITPALVSEHQLSEEEYALILDILGREPSLTELGIFSAMWSEHCSYKSSRKYLRTFPTTGPRVVQGPGENAGVVDLGDGLCAAFKMESHNHPSYIEPYQGAATGVGGILRDVFTMGARPVASLNSLRFGDLAAHRMKHLVDGVVRGIAGYGNCIGIPTLGGETTFHRAYNGNILVNVFNVGLVARDRIFKGRAAGAGNPVVYVGSKTGRDGIHGATMASAEFGPGGASAKRPNVQVGDPFTEKKLIEACLELIHRKLVVSMQDLGAAGLTSSSSEMASKGVVGLDIHADRVPLREADMEPWEIMISESQERMLAIVTGEQIADVREVCERWDLDCTVIGEVTDSKMLRIWWHGERVANIPARRLADESPVIRTPSVKPGYIVDEPVAVDDAAYPRPKDLGAALTQLLAAPNIASKRWAWEQYDYIVQANTMQIPGSDAAVLRIKDSQRGIAFSNDCNGRHCYLDPYRGAKAAVAEAARNLVCAGALPVAVTDCLNFGNPEKGEIYWQFEQAVEGIAQACEALDTPVVSGNVSFYNESFGQAIYPTPMIGMLGVYDDVSVHVDDAFKDDGDVIVMLGAEAAWMDGSEYQKVAYGKVEGRVPDVDLQLEVELQNKLRAAIEARLLKSAHDCAEGGLSVALAECCIASGSTGGAQFEDPEAPRSRDGRWLGADVDLGSAAAVAGAAGRPDLALFGEAPSRVIVTVAPELLGPLDEVLGRLPHRVLGRVTGTNLRCTMQGKELFTVPVGELHSAYESLPQRL